MGRGSRKISATGAAPSRAPLSRGATHTAAPAPAGAPARGGLFASLREAVRRGNAYMARRFGFDGKQNLALVGAALAAPVAAVASPVLGFGLVGALTAPHLLASARRQRGEQTAAPVAGGLQVDPEEWAATQQRIADLTVLAREQLDHRERTDARLERLEQQVGALNENVTMMQLALQEREFGTEALERAAKQKSKRKAAKTPVDRGPRVDAQEILARLQPQGPFNREQYLEQRRRAHEGEPPLHVMPSKLHWQEEILSGGMCYDFRPEALRDLRPGARCALVATGEAGAGPLVGYYDAADVFEISSENLERIWPRLEGNLGEGWTRENFERYLKGTPGERLTMVEIANVQRMRTEVSGRELLGTANHPSRVKKARQAELHKVLDENDAALVEQAAGAYPLNTGSEPSEPMLYRALLSKFRDGEDLNADLALPKLTEADLERLEERYGEAWRAHCGQRKAAKAEERAG